MEKIKIGILSTANIGLRSVIPAIQLLEDTYELKGIASRDHSKAKKVADELGIQAYDYDGLLNSDLDAVYIPLPNSMHYEWVMKALRQGKHVLVEKSMGMNLLEVMEMNEVAKQHGLALVENFQFRFHRQLKVIMHLVDSGKIGELRCMRSSFGFPLFPDKENIRYQAELGGGALFDAGAYPIKVSQLMLGEDLKVEGASLWKDPALGVDIWGGGFLKQRNGSLFSEIAFGFDHFYQCNIELWGSKGKLYTNRIFTARPDFTPKIIVETNDGSEAISVEPDHHFRNFLTNFSVLVRGEKEKEFEYMQNVNQARLLEEFKKVAIG